MKTPVLALLIVTVVFGSQANGDTADALKALEQTYREQAASYKIFRDQEQSQQLVLSSAPVYKWTDAQAQGNTGGLVFIWTWRGKPEAIAAIFSNPVGTQHRRITHEFHSLSTKTLRPATSDWRPESGIQSTLVPSAPEVARTRTARLVQMRSLARRFTGNTIDREGQRWEMRFLPQPLFRQTATEDDDELLDGAVFAFVTSELTDPEVILRLESTRTNEGYRWSYSLVRFSGFRTYVRYNGEELWTSIPLDANHNQDRTYQLLQQPLIAETWR